MRETSRKITGMNRDVSKHSVQQLDKLWGLIRCMTTARPRRLLMVQVTSTTATLTDLRPDHWYQVRVAAVNVYGSQGWSPPSAAFTTAISESAIQVCINPLMGIGNYSATSNNMKLVHWPLMGGLLHLVQRGGDWAGLQPAQAPPRCTKCNSPPINGQCTNHRIAV